MKKVIYLGAKEGFEAASEILSDLANLIHPLPEIGAVSQALPDAHALLDASMKVRISNELIESSPELQIISCATTGSDHIERDVLEKRGIPVRTLKEDPDLLMNLTPAAELSWTLLMACARRLPAAVDHVKNGKWERELFPGIMLNGKRLGIIGCGRIGGWMARYGRAFGMEILGFDTHLQKWPDYIQRVDLETLMRSSDFISIHVHLTPETQGLVSRDCLAKVKPGVVIINTSRGAIIDEQALLEGLKANRIHGVGLDVLTDEPDIESNPLVKYSKEHDNVLITPHCGGFSPDAVRIVCTHAAKKIRSALIGDNS